jgi:class 3 adenylate cyclase
MKSELSDIDKFERIVFKKNNPLDYLLSFSLKLMQARHVGLLLGTNQTYLKFLPPVKWDRGVMHKFNGKGISGIIFKCFGNFIVNYKGLSPVMLYKNTQSGEKKQTDGIISFVLRTHKNFYEQGTKILIIDMSATFKNNKKEKAKVSVLSFDGIGFKTLPDLKINNSIVRQFKSKNFVSAYIPDYGAIVFNTVQKELLHKIKKEFIHDKELKKRLNLLISAIEIVSLANIGRARGKQAAQVIWRKEKRLRKTALKLKKKAVELNAQKEYLRAVGAVNENQLNMEAVKVGDGVYAFMDMVGSASLRKYLKPREYFYILNWCHQIAANNASLYSCRVDNFMGDCVSLQNASPFDKGNIAKHRFSMGLHERIMLMILALAATFNEINILQTGYHNMDKTRRVKKMIQKAQIKISFRAGLETGPAVIGPLGSEKRKIVTAIGEAVNNASRLECCGKPGQIHTSQAIMEILKDSCITKNMKNISQIIDNKRNNRKSGVTSNPVFFDYFKKKFKLGDDMVAIGNDISYKEFSPDITYLIQCIPDEILPKA